MNKSEMKKSKSPYALHRVAVLSLLGSLACALVANAQEAVPVLHSKERQLSVLDGYKMRRNSWTVSADEDPDIFVSQVPPGTIKAVKFISTEAELVFKVEGGKSYPFNIIYGGQIYHTKIVGNVGPDTYDLKF